MLLAMSELLEKEDSVVNFPVQKRTDLDNLSNDELVHQGLLAWTRVINMAIAGTYQLTESNKQSIRQFDKMASKLGYASLINEDFESL